MAAQDFLVSIIIPNYNYADFLPEAIDSALNLDWPHVEVIVVDDGSTDRSRAVIERYGSRIISAFQANTGQTAACNLGFSRARGAVIIFLDADDKLDPSLMREVAKVWHPGVSKVQVQMRVIDAQGEPTGNLLPQYTVLPTPERIRRWLAASGTYPTPPGSGNVYAREFIEQISPLAGSERASDSYYIAAAPYFGDVITIAEPLVSYRVHGRNDGSMTELDPRRMRREVARAQWRFAYAQGLARARGSQLSDSAFRFGLVTLAYRAASQRLSPRQHPLSGDTRVRLLKDVAKAFWIAQGLSLSSRVTFLVWVVLVTLAPRALAERLIVWRFVPGRRPAVLQRTLSILGTVRAVRNA